MSSPTLAEPGPGVSVSTVAGWLLRELRAHHSRDAAISVVAAHLSVGAHTAALALMAMTLRNVGRGGPPSPFGTATTGFVTEPFVTGLGLLLLLLTAAGFSHLSAMRAAALTGAYLDRCARRVLASAQASADCSPQLLAAALRFVNSDVSPSANVARHLLVLVPACVASAVAATLALWLQPLTTILLTAMAVPFALASHRLAVRTSALAHPRREAVSHRAEVQALMKKGLLPPEAVTPALWEGPHRFVEAQRLESLVRLLGEAFAALALVSLLLLSSFGPGRGLRLGSLAAYLIVIRYALGAVQGVNSGVARLGRLWPRLVRHYRVVADGALLEMARAVPEARGDLVPAPDEEETP